MRLFTHRQFIITTSLLATSAHAAGLPIDPSMYPDPNQLLTPSVVNPLVRTIGLALDHRPFEPATALGTAIGLDIGIEVALARVPDDLGPALAEAKGGASGGEGKASTPASLPVPRFSLHKGLGPNFGVGFSAIYYQGYRVYGGDAKLTFLQPEEGPTFALRFCYTSADIKIVSTHTYTPQLLVSRSLEFADPYAGIGYQLTYGTIEFPFKVPVLDQTVNLTAKGKGRSFMAFVGVQFKVPHSGLLMALEGSYSQVGIHGLGTKFGFAF